MKHWQGSPLGCSSPIRKLGGKENPRRLYDKCDTHRDSNCCLSPAGWGNRLPEGISQPASFPHAFSCALRASFFPSCLIILSIKSFHPPASCVPPATTSEGWKKMYVFAFLFGDVTNDVFLKKAEAKCKERGKEKDKTVSDEIKPLRWENDIKEWRQKVRQIVTDSSFLLSRQKDVTGYLLCSCVFAQMVSDSAEIHHKQSDSVMRCSDD